MNSTKASYSFLYFLSALLFCAYPLALISPAESGFFDIYYNFNFHIPIIPLAVVASSIYLLASFPWAHIKSASKIQKLEVGTIAILALLLCKYPAAPLALLKQFSYILVPLALAEANRKAPQKNKILIIPFVLIFALTCSHSFWSRGSGLSGNINWLAAALLASAPFLLLSLKSRQYRLQRTFLILPLFSYGFYLWFEADSRASSLSLLTAIGWAILMHLSHKKMFKTIALLLILVSSSAFFAFKSDKFARIEARDIRLPLWQTTSAMIAEAPLLGHGPGNFVRKYPQFRLKKQQLRIVAAINTRHPHNEFLLIAAEMGIPFLLIVIFLILLAITYKKDDSTEKKFAVFAFITIMTHGLLDKTISQDPTSLMALILFGFCLQKIKTSTETSSLPVADGSEKSPRILILVPIALALFVGIYSLMNCINYSISSNALRTAQMDYDQASHQNQKNHAVYRTIVEKLIEADATYPNPDALLYACLTSVDVLKDPDLALPLLQKLDREWPDYSQTHRYIGQCLELFALREKDRQAQRRFLRQASDHYALNASKHPGIFESLYTSLAALVRIGDTKSALGVQQQIKETAEAKRLESSFAWQIGTQPTEEWHKLSYKGRAEAIQMAKEYLSIARVPSSGDPFFKDLMRYENLKDFTAAPFNTYDLAFWQQIAHIQERFPQSLKESCLQIAQEIKLTPQGKAASFSIIPNKSNKLTPTEAIALISELAQQKNSDALILKENNSYRIFVFLPKEILELSTNNNKITYKNLEPLNFIKTHKNKKFLLFSFASALTNRNEILSLSLKSKENKPLFFSRKPSIRLLNMQKKLGFLPRTQLMQEPFIDFNEQMKNSH